MHEKQLKFWAVLITWPGINLSHLQFRGNRNYLGISLLFLDKLDVEMEK